MIVRHARCSTETQDVEGQIVSLKQAGAEKIYAEKVSGVVTDRRELAKAIASLNSGDLLVVTKLDRLARSMRDLLNTLSVVSDKGAHFKVLDTTSAHGNLLLNILGAKSSVPNPRCHG